MYIQQKMFMIINNIAFSMEVWDWYHNRKHDVTATDNTLISTFKQLMAVPAVKCYGDLDGWEFFEMLTEVYKFYTDIHEKVLDKNITFDMQEKELMALEKRIVFWAITEGHEKADFGKDVRGEYLDSKRMAFNQKFHVECCYMMKSIWLSFNNLKIALNGSEMRDIGEINIYNSMHELNDEEIDEFIKKVIRHAYGGDFDEFIISVMERMKSRKMNKYHEKIAKVKAYELFGKEDFDTCISKSETWRMLFNNYFDGKEDVYVEFYNAFIGDCISFLYLDYLSWDMEIDYIPVYKQYCNKNHTLTSQNIRFFIDIGKISSQIKKLYSISL